MRSFCGLILIILGFHSTLQAQLQLVENNGQWPSEVIAAATIPTGMLFVQCDRLRFKLYNDDLRSSRHINNTDEASMEYHCYDLIFGDEGEVESIFSEVESYHINYYLGKDRGNWASGSKVYNELLLKNIISGVDMRLYAADGNLKYDLRAVSSLALSKLKLKYKGIKPSLEGGGVLLKSKFGLIYEPSPIAWHESTNGKESISCSYSLKGHSLSFRTDDNLANIVVDPKLIFATYSGSVSDNWGFTACNAENGNSYLGGVSFGNSYPNKVGTYDDTHNGDRDIIIAKFSSQGNALLYYTYLGGSGRDQPFSLNVDGDDNLVILGHSNSGNYPAISYDTTYNGRYDIIVTKLNSTGTVLLGSTYLGGSLDDGYNSYQANNFLNQKNQLNYNYGDFCRGDITTDSLGNLYIVANSSSSDFPISQSAYQDTLGGKQDAIIASFSPDLKKLRFSTYLGGTDDDATYSLLLENNSIYACGGTKSSNLPLLNSGHNKSYSDSVDAFIVRFDTLGRSLLASTFYGRQYYDQAYFLQSNNAGEVFVYGQTMSNISLSPGYGNPPGKQFVAKYNSNLDTMIWHTRFGTMLYKGPEISPSAFLVDECEERIFIAGWGGETNRNASGSLNNPELGYTTGLDITNNAYQDSTNGSDFYLMVMEKDASSLLYATFFGGNVSQEHVDGGTSRFDKSGVIYQAVCASCGGNQDFPVTPSAFSQNNNSLNCNMALIKMDFELGKFVAGFDWELKDPCAPYSVKLTNRTNRDSTKISSYWITSLGDTSTAYKPTFNFLKPGTYTVKLISKLLGQSSCPLIDSVEKRITILPPTEANFTVLPDTQVCVGDTVFIQNISSSDTLLEFSWEVSDGQKSTDVNPKFVFNSRGSFTIHLFTLHKICSTRDTSTLNIEVRGKRIKADFSLIKNTNGSSDCLPIVLNTKNNSSTGGQSSFLWYLIADPISTIAEPILTLTKPQSYIVKLLLIDSLACFIADSASKTYNINLFSKGNYSSFCTCKGLEKEFTFTAPSGINNITWEGPDQFFSAAFSITVSLPGAYYLNGSDSEGCLRRDTFLIDERECFTKVPNVITPNSDGKNDFFFPELSDAEEFELKIFNRWGNKVYDEFSDKPGGKPWPGTKGHSQKRVDPGEYFYILSGKFCDGEEIKKHGTLKVIYNN